MNPSPSIAAYCRDPVGHYVVGRTFLDWWATPELSGIVLWGRPDLADVRALLSCTPAEERVPTPRDSLLDLSRVAGVDVNAFNSLLEWAGQTRSTDDVRLRRRAVVRAPGFIGAVAAGFFAVHRPGYAVSIFEDMRSACAWLESGSPALMAELERLSESAAGAPVVVALRAALSSRLDADIDTVARQMGLSERTLQRRLQEAGTSFVEELHAAQLYQAKVLMVDTHMKLETIADAVGCASPQHLALLFRKVHGQSPSDWRDAHAAKRAPATQSWNGTLVIKP